MCITSQRDAHMGTRRRLAAVLASCAAANGGQRATGGAGGERGAPAPTPAGGRSPGARARVSTREKGRLSRGMAETASAKHERQRRVQRAGQPPFLARQNTF